MSHKPCRKCLAVKPFADFPTDKRMRDGRAARCLACDSAVRKATYAAHPEKFKARKNQWAASNRDKVKVTHRKSALKKYGLTLDGFAERLKAQGGRCAICEVALSAQPHLPNSPHADHSHTTGKLRDILCHKCNIGLGCYGDKPEIMRRAADYLERHNATS